LNSSSSEHCHVCQRLKTICQCALIGIVLAAPIGHAHAHEPDRAPGQPLGKFQVTMTSSSSASSTGTGIDYRTPGWPPAGALTVTLS
jgi:hypothetical protein